MLQQTTTLPLGAKAPSFELPTTAGELVSLEALADREAIVIEFHSNVCPYVHAWEPRLSAIATGFAEKGVAVVAINANDLAASPRDSFSAMVERVAKKGLAFVYAKDETQAVARAFGAEKTPEVMLFDRDRRLVYRGAVDDSSEEEDVQVSYLRDAIEAVLAGRSPEIAETPAIGCGIKWRTESENGSSGGCA
jgi:peroxiredoxin